jgi:hypothetical protein
MTTCQCDSKARNLRAVADFFEKTMIAVNTASYELLPVTAAHAAKSSA